MGGRDSGLESTEVVSGGDGAAGSSGVPVTASSGGEARVEAVGGTGDGGGNREVAVGALLRAVAGGEEGVPLWGPDEVRLLVSENVVEARSIG